MPPASESIPVALLAIGCSDSSFSGRLFRRQVGMNPVQSRQRLGRPARELQQMAGHGG